MKHLIAVTVGLQFSVVLAVGAAYVLLPLLFAAPTPAPQRITVTHDDSRVAIEWQAVYPHRTTDVYLGANRIRTAAPGIERMEFDLPHFGVALFTARQGQYAASATLSMGRVLFDPVEGADGYVVYLSQDHVLSTALRHEVGALTDIELVNFGLSPGEWFVWVASLAGGRESVKAGPESFVWRNALVSP